MEIEKYQTIIFLDVLITKSNDYFSNWDLTKTINTSDISIRIITIIQVNNKGLF